jgi:hypothetical protein
MNPMNPNLYGEQYGIPTTTTTTTTSQLVQNQPIGGQFIQQPIGGQFLEGQIDQQMLANQALTNTNQRDIDRIIVHDNHGMPIKREHGAIYKGDVENRIHKAGVEKVDPYVPAHQTGIIGQSGMLHNQGFVQQQPGFIQQPGFVQQQQFVQQQPGFVQQPGLIHQTEVLHTQQVHTTAPLTETTNVEGVQYDEYGQPKKQGFMGKVKGALAGWKEKRREKKIRKQEEKEGRTGSRSSSPSLSPEREGGYVAPTTTATTGLTHPDVTHTLPTYQTAATGIPIRDTTKDYVRNLGMEVPIGTSADPAFAKKDKKHTGAWDYADQRIQKIETHFPEGVQTERVLLTQQVPVIVEQVRPVIVEHVQPVVVTQQVPVSEVVTTTYTEQIPIQQQQQFTELTTTQIQNLTCQGLTEIPTTQLAHLQINTELPVGTTFTPANQLSENIAVNMPYESNLQATNFQQQNLQHANFQYQQSSALQPGMLGDLTSTGALRTIPETGLSNQGSFGYMGSGSSQPQVQETITRTVEKEIINHPQNFHAPKY